MVLFEANSDAKHVIHLAQNAATGYGFCLVFW
jgi:hypothetical protein